MLDPDWRVAAMVFTLLINHPMDVTGQSVVFRADGVRPFVRNVLVHNDGLKAVAARTEAWSERIAPAGALPDPSVTLGVASLPTPSFDFTSERMTRLPVGIQLRFPFPGKQAAATNRARADSAFASETLVHVEDRLAAEAVVAYYAMAHAQTVVDIWRQRVALADLVVVVTQSRYESGEVTQADVLTARLRRAQLDDEGISLQADTTRTRSLATALLGEGADGPVVFALLNSQGQPTVPVGRDSLPNVDGLEIPGAAPAMRVAKAAIQQSERTARVMDIASRPDFSVGLETGIRFGGREPFTTAMIGVSVPLWAGRKQTPTARAARLDLDATRYEYGDLKHRLTAEFRDLTAELHGLRARVVVVSDEVIPLAVAASNSALQRYGAGAVSITIVLDMQDALFSAQTQLAALIKDYATRRAQWSVLVGEEWYQ